MLILLTRQGKILKVSESSIKVSRLYSDTGKRYYPKGVKIIDLDPLDEVVSMGVI